MAVAESHRHVQAFACQVNPVVVGEQPQVDKRMRRLKVWQALQQPPQCEAGHHAHAQRLARAAFPQALDRIGHAAEGINQRGQQGLGLVSEGQAAWQAPEQHHAQPLLQILHMLADGRRGEMQFLGGAGEAELARRHLEGTQGIERQVHGSPSSFS
jgi:hypothetical protein